MKLFKVFLWVATVIGFMGFSLYFIFTVDISKDHGTVKRIRSIPIIQNTETNSPPRLPPGWKLLSPEPEKPISPPPEFEQEIPPPPGLGIDSPPPELGVEIPTIPPEVLRALKDQDHQSMGDSQIIPGIPPGLADWDIPPIRTFETPNIPRPPGVIWETPSTRLPKEFTYRKSISIIYYHPQSWWIKNKKTISTSGIIGFVGFVAILLLYILVFLYIKTTNLFKKHIYSWKKDIKIPLLRGLFRLTISSGIIVAIIISLIRSFNERWDRLDYYEIFLSIGGTVGLSIGGFCLVWFIGNLTRYVLKGFYNLDKSSQ